MNYRKERNFINAYEYGEFCGGFDFSTGSFVGKSGKHIKGKPIAFAVKNMPHWRNIADDDCVTHAVCFIIEHHRAYATDITTEGWHRLEKIVSVGLRLRDSWNASVLDEDIKLDKSFVSFIKNNYRGIISNQSIGAYKVNQLFQNEEMPSWVVETMPYLVRSNLPMDYIKSVILRCVREHTEEMISNMGGYIERYYRMSMDMYGKCEVKPNFLTNFCYLSALHEQYKEAHYDENLKKYNDLPILYFEDDTFIVRPLLTRKDFAYEAEHQHNCVERMYMDKVASGGTHVVVVRKKDAPNTSFITCEVTNKGQIWQYLYGCNRRVYEGTEDTFRVKYQNHLTANWGE